MTDPASSFIEAACVRRDASHVSGTLETARRILAEHPDVARASIHTAAVLGDVAGVREFLDRDPSLATAQGGPHDWDALTHLCFSRFLRLDESRSDDFVHAARALLDAGADANTGWWEPDHQPEPEWEPALYGAAGIAHHPELTRLLLERGADPNANEVVYHTPEGYDNRAMVALLESRSLTEENLALMLIRKHDWHDLAGVRLLLEHGMDLKRARWRHFRPMQHATRRDNDIAIFEALLDHGADPTLAEDGASAVAAAARFGRRDLLELYERRGFATDLEGVDRLIAACAWGDSAGAHSIAEREPALLPAMLARQGDLLARFAGTGNAQGVACLIDLGADIGAVSRGDGYWGLAPGTTALHAAAWRAAHRVVSLLVARGAPAHARDENGRTPIMLAVRACVDSHWTELRAPDSIRTLLDAGASIEGVRFPSGYAEVDELLHARGAAT